jgi:Rrf2 family transcriptional regulator, cysteine metabolism repressor
LTQTKNGGNIKPSNIVGIGEMRVTTKSRYGLRAMIQLAIDTLESKTTTLGSIAEKQELSERYLEQIFSLLKNGGLVKSTRGVKGGYALARNAIDITVADIIKVLEDPVEIVACLREDACPKDDECIAHRVWKKIFDCMMGCAASINLCDMIAMTEEKGIATDGKHNIFGPCCNNKDEG